MRFELLERYGETALLEKEMKHLCGYMLSREPGTFWETLSGTDSRNHPFPLRNWEGVIPVSCLNLRRKLDTLIYPTRTLI